MPRPAAVFIDTADIYQFGQSEEVHHEVTPIDLGLLLGVQVVGVTPSG
jgi:hypothetical protein